MILESFLNYENRDKKTKQKNQDRQKEIAKASLALKSACLMLLHCNSDFSLIISKPDITLQNLLYLFLNF